MDFREQWEKADMDLIRKLADLHNQICMKDVDEREFDGFVLKNKERINNPDYLQIFAARISFHSEYFNEHFEMCKLFYDFMQNNPDWQKLNFGFSTLIRLGLFEDEFKEHLESRSNQTV